MTVVSSIMTVSVLPVVDIKFVIYYMTNLISGRRTLSSLSASKLVSLLSQLIVIIIIVFKVLLLTYELLRGPAPSHLEYHTNPVDALLSERVYCWFPVKVECGQCL